MNKKFKYYIAAWAVLFVVFNIIAFAVPAKVSGANKYDGAFWAGYVFITLAFIGQLVCAYFALKAENLTKLFYNLPLITISYTGLILTIIFGAVCMFVPGLLYWVCIIVCVLILGFTAVAVIKASAAAPLIEKTEVRVKEKTAFIRMMTVEAENLTHRAQTNEAKAACRKVYEALRYSDPMSSDALADIENEISQELDKFAKAVINQEEVAALADELVNLIGDRNRKCKILK